VAALKDREEDTALQTDIQFASVRASRTYNQYRRDRMGGMIVVVK
jgi:hypothetical protein